MPGTGKPKSRKRQNTVSVIEAESLSSMEQEPERLNILGSSTQRGKNKIIDFEKLIQESLELTPPCSNIDNATPDNIYPIESRNTIQNLDLGVPERMRCGGDNLGCHVPEPIQTKIKQHEYVNLSLLLKGGIELANLQDNCFLGVDEDGHLVTKPKACSEKNTSIEIWSDAFLIFSSIYLSAHPEQTQDLLQYMFIIREAAGKYKGDFWQVYDEQFRLRQASQFMPWSSINSDLWLRCFSGAGNPPLATRAPAHSKPPPCIDFNKGFCKWVNCRYNHVCSICYAPQHGLWNCPNPH
ncbi:uncharacterized protein LOC128556771 [Mercenaria mercenaria]|uniref:uncharacterized protein LOC128556771 n=1 Tax=Mercenaria mercenaria TaxID=6596 RepID=UPI00234E46D0|nr:uncharacterized protein LOC128556771 [Mercenaria mercenaria]